MLKLLGILLLSTASNINCADSSCSSCTIGYLYNSISCLPLCPSGYTQSSSPNACAAVTQSLFYLNFWEFREFAVTSIGNFQHPTGLQFQDSAKLSPIPTMERGFYFASTSRLMSNVNYIIGPDFTLRLCIRIKADGTIFEATDGTISYFKLAAVSGKVAAYWYLTSTTTSSTSSLTSFTYTSNWVNIVMYSSQSTGLFSMNLASYTSSASGFEFRGQVSDLVCYFGGYASGGSFTGFLHEMHADNLVTTTYILMLPTINCEYNQYYDMPTYSCITCTGCSATWPWCARASCTVCYTSSCTTCTGFTYSYCTSCNNGRTAPDCLNALFCASQTGTYACTVCNTGYTLIDGLCLIQPYNYNAAALSTPVININFNTFAQYYGGIFQNGANAATWAPFNSPDTDDPIPVNSRGLYFDGGTKYLVSTSKVVMNYKSSLALWMYPQNSWFPVCTQRFYTFGLNYAMLVISNYGTDTFMYTYNTQTLYNQWIFSGYSINFVSGTLTISYTFGTTVSEVFSINGYALYDPGTLMWIGKYATVAGYNFLGFIYSFALWQTAIDSLTTAYDTCGTGLGGSCIWNSGLTQYYNSYENTYFSCDSGCTSGCSTWGTCNQCLSSAVPLAQTITLHALQQSSIHATLDIHIPQKSIAATLLAVIAMGPIPTTASPALAENTCSLRYAYLHILWDTQYPALPAHNLPTPSSICC